VRSEGAAARRPCGGRTRLDLAPGLAAWAVARAPAGPLLAEHHPDTAHWRDLAIDPGLAGVKPARSRATEVHIGCTDRPGLWRVPVSGVLGELAWHPELPLVAGLLVRGRQARPWTADYRARTVTVHDGVRAATSLGELGPDRRAPMTWHGHRLLLLVPAGRPGTVTDDTSPVPLVFDATGPGHVEFEPDLDVLAGLAAARIASLDPADGTVTPLTAPLLVRELSVPDDGEAPLAVVAAGAPDRTGLRWSARLLDPSTGRLATVSTADGRRVRCVQEGARVRLEVRGETHRLALPPGVARLGRAAPPPRPRGAGPAPRPPARLVLDCVSADGRPGIAVVDVDRPAVTVAWAPPGTGSGPALGAWPADRGDGAELVVHTPSGLRHYALRGDRLEPVPGALPDLPAHTVREEPREHLRVGAATLSLPGDTGGTGKGEAGPPGPLVLWLQADDAATAVPGLPGAVPRALGATGYPCAVLRMPLEWPADAPADTLRSRVADAVEAGVSAVEKHAADRFDGRVVVGGHSFGATLALVALAAIPRLAGAVAHSGCYNRTLTPTGFQYERRPYWDAPAVYEAFSALLFADRLDRPVLLVHGTEDTNRATPPEQAVELYRGIVATGGRARLVLLPCEGHTYVHAETHRHLTEVHRDWLEQWRGQEARR
jgi:dienelactone hydrolase